MRHARDGRVRWRLHRFPDGPPTRRCTGPVLAVSTRQRVPALPEVPAIAEAGLPTYEYRDWWGLFVPAGTPESIIDKSAREVARILALPDVQKQLLLRRAQASPMAPAEFGAFVRASIEEFRKVAASTGMRPE